MVRINENNSLLKVSKVTLSLEKFKIINFFAINYNQNYISLLSI